MKLKLQLKLLDRLNSIEVAKAYLEKKELINNTVNKPLVIAVFGLVFFVAFFLFFR